MSLQNVKSSIIDLLKLYKWYSAAIFLLWLVIFLIPFSRSGEFTFSYPVPTLFMLSIYTILPVILCTNILYSTKSINTPFIIKIKTYCAIIITWVTFIAAVLVLSLFAIGKLNFVNVFYQIGAMMLYTLLAYSFSAFAYSVTTTKKAAFLTSFTLPLSFFLIAESVILVFNTFFSTIYFSTHDFAIMSLSPFTRFMTTSTHPMTIWSVIFYILLGFSVFFISLRIIKTNDSQSLLTLTAAFISKFIVKYTLLLSLVVFVGSVCYQIGGILIMILAYINLLILGHIVLEYILTGYIKNSIIHYKGILIFTIIFGIFTTATISNFLNFDNYIPTASNIKSVKFMLGSSDDFIKLYNHDDSTLFKDTNIFELSDSQSIQHITDIISKIINTNGYNRKKIVNNFVEAYMPKIADETYFDLSVEYKLTNGITILKKYKDVVYSNIYLDFQELYSSDEYKSKNPIFYLSELPNMVTVDNTIIKDEAFMENISELIDFLKQDIQNKTFETLMEPPYSEIYLENINDNKIKSSIGITVYPSYTNSVAFLQKYDIGKKAPSKKDIVYAYVYDTSSISSYVTITPYNFSTISSTLPPAEKISDKNKLSAILDNALLIAPGKSYSPYLLLDKNYVIIPQFNNSNSSWNKSIYMYPIFKQPK